MHKLTEAEVQMWERRRRNMRILITAAGTDGTNVARSVEMSPNTLTKFLRGETPTLSTKSLDKVLPALDLTHVGQLDTDNPLTDPKIRLQRVIDQIDGPESERLARELEARYLSDK